MKLQYVIPLIALIAAGCAGPSLEKARSDHYKKYPVRPLPMPNGRPFVVEKPEPAATYTNEGGTPQARAFAPAAVGVGGVMVGKPRIEDGYLVDTAHQGSNTVLRCWRVKTVDGPRGFYPIAEFACWPQHQLFEIWSPLTVDGNQGYIEGENEACVYETPNAFSPANRLFVKVKINQFVDVDGKRHERFRVGGPGVHQYDPNSKVFLLEPVVEPK